MQTSAYIIWPDGMPFKHSIRARIEKRNLKIARRREVVISTDFFDELYPSATFTDLPLRARKQMQLLNCHLPSEIGIVHGTNAIKKLVEIIGKHGNPAKCAIGSVRNDFGVFSSEVIDDFILCMKVMHRPRTYHEFLEQLPLIRKRYFPDT